MTLSPAACRGLCSALLGLALLAPGGREPHVVANQSPTVIRFVEGTVFAERDERVEMVLEAVDVEDLAGYQVTIQWDPRILEYIDIEVLEDFMTASGRTIDYTPPVVSDDTVTLATYTVPPTGVPVPGASGAGELLRVGFRTLRSGRSEIGLPSVLLTTTRNDAIPADVESGQVVVVGPPGPVGTVYLPVGAR